MYQSLLQIAAGLPPYYNKAVIYGLLFDIAAETLRTIAADPKHLGAQIGATLVAYLGLRAHASSPCAWHCSRWWVVAGSKSVGGV